jgi:multiple RNA-binding domain-containing protein 1
VEEQDDTGRLFVRNLPFSASEDDLYKLFKKHGDISEVHIPIDRETKKPRGMAYVTFMLPEVAAQAHAALDGSIFQVKRTAHAA